jgi:hypothetical protein
VQLVSSRGGRRACAWLPRRGNALVEGGLRVPGRLCGGAQGAESEAGDCNSDGGRGGPRVVPPATADRPGALGGDSVAVDQYLFADDEKEVRAADLVAAGDDWLRTWLPQVIAGSDYRSGRLTVIVTWDEGTSTSNHIPTLVLAPEVRQVSPAQPLTHCSTLRFMEQQLGLPLLGCAASAASLGTAFGL